MSKTIEIVDGKVQEVKGPERFKSVYIAGRVTDCDFQQIEYDEPRDGLWALAEGCGRVCCVMFVGPDYPGFAELKVTSREEAEAECERLGLRAEF